MNIWTHIELLVILLLFLVAVGVFSRFKLWPAVTSVRDLADLLNTKGGVILMLGAMSMVFFFTGMRWLYWSTMLIVHKETCGRQRARAEWLQLGFRRGLHGRIWCDAECDEGRSCPANTA